MELILPIIFFVVIMVLLLRQKSDLAEIQDRQKSAMRLTHQRLEAIEKSISVFGQREEQASPEDVVSELEVIEEPQPSEPVDMAELMERIEKKRVEQEISESPEPFEEP